MMLIEQKTVITRTREMSPRPPAGEPITRARMYGRAWPAGAVMMSCSGGRVAQIGMMKNRPAIPPTGTERAIARGTFTSGSAHSSAIEVIIPIPEKVYAAGRRPMKKVKFPQPAKDLS